MSEELSTAADNTGPAGHRERLRDRFVKGGADAMPVLVRGDQLSRALRLDKLLRLKVFPIAVSLPWGIAPAALPQFPLPAKIRTRLMPAVELDHNPKRADDDEYLEEKYWEVQNSIQRGMDALARKRALPRFG